MNYDDPILGDVLYEDNTIVLLPKDSWTPSPQHPSGWTWDAKARTLRLSQQTFVSSADLLGTQNFLAVIFAGCTSFSSASSAQFRAAVQNVLSACRKVTIVHNKDLITTLLVIFPRVEELVLPHNIRLQFTVSEDIEKMPCAPPLRSIRGDSCGIGVNHLFMEKPVIIYLHVKCKKLNHMDVNLDEVMDVIFSVDAVLHMGGDAPRWKSYILGAYRQRSTLDNIVVHTDITQGMMFVALSFNNRVHRLQLVTGREEVVNMVTRFKSMKSVSITFVRGLCPFGICFPEALKKFALHVLELRYFSDVKLSLILQSCSNLHTLSLLDCVVSKEELKSGTFHELRVLRIGRETAFSLTKFELISQELFTALVERCPNLTELQLSGVELCGMFLQLHYKKSHFAGIQKLILWTKESMKGLGLNVADLQALVKDMRSLKCVATDSYEIRLCLETYAPHVKLEWLSCTKCAAEFAATNGTEMVKNNFFADICGSDQGYFRS